MQRMQRALMSSGMTQDQVRDRLRAGGYSESLLDSYMTPGARSAQPPSDEAFAAMRYLGVLDSAQTDSIRSGRRPAPIGSHADSLFADSVSRAIRDSATRAAIRAVIRNRAHIEMNADSGFSVFGHDVFATETSQFDPMLAGPVGPDYRVGPGDQFVVVLTGQTEAVHQLQVTREGVVVIPGVGPLAVANLTMAQLHNLVIERLGRVYSDIRRRNGDTQVTISMVRLGTIQISVLGDVRVPGTYRVSRIGNVLASLYAAGGPTDRGSMRVVELKRAGRTIGQLDLYDYFLSGSGTNDLRPETGDVVFVPPHGPLVRVAGAVVRPATYELRPGETLADAVRMAGGFDPTADRSRLQIERILPPTARTAAGAQRTQLDVSSPLLASGFGPPVPLEAGDVIRVRAIAKRVVNRVLVSGNVWSGGPIALVPGMRLSQAIKAAGGLKPDTYLETVQISRLEPDSTRRMLRTEFVDTAGNAVDDVLLQDADEIRVFSATEFRPELYVTVNGAVRRAGKVPFRHGMTVRDAVLLAGGLAENASQNEAIIGRMPEHAQDGRTTISLRVRLDSGYVMARAVNGHDGNAGRVTQAGAADNVTLQPYDNVLILQQPEWTLPRSAVILGEVKRPGRYTLESKGERLRDLVNKAGGFTGNAYLGGIVFIRTRDTLRVRGDSARAAMDSSPAALRVNRAEGRIGVDLSGVMKNAKHPDNIILADGDSVFIPVMEQVVRVTGAVQSPAAVAFAPGQRLDYYIRLAGGATATADVGRAFVAQPNGKLESRGRGLHAAFFPPQPKPGSTVYVPIKAESRGTDLVSLVATTTSLISGIVTLVLLLRR